jgi:hypothetical protein
MFTQKPVLALTLILSLSAQAISASAKADAPFRKSNLAALQKVAGEAAELMQNSDCKLEVMPSKDGLTLSLSDDKKSVTVRLGASDPLKLSDSEESDGSFVKDFKLPNGASFSQTHADDAFDHVSLSDGRTTVECGMDY